MTDILDDNEDYQEDIEQVEDNEVIDDEQDLDDSQDGEKDDDDEQDDSTDDDVLDFSFDDDGEDKDPYIGQEAPAWVKETREKYRETQRENRKLKQQLEQRGGQPEQQALREKPTLDAHEYDSDAYEQDYAEWLSEKSQHEAKAQAEQQKYQHYDERYKSSVDAVRAKVADYDEIEQSIVETVPPQRQALIKMLVDDPARMVVALGKSPSKLESLLSLDDIQFAKQIVLMEQQMSSTSKSRNQNKPKPKTHELEGAAGGADAKLSKLEAEADRTNDRSALIAYRKQMKNK